LNLCSPRAKVEKRHEAFQDNFFKDSYAMRCRWAIVGTGEAAGKFAIGLRSVPAEVALVASRSADRAARFARQLKIPASVGSYEEAARASVDAVYIATPPSEHLSNALLFIRAGKSVLIEKPLANSAASVAEIIAAARSRNVFCMEGMWTRFLPALQVARTSIRDGVIGSPRWLQASFAAADLYDPENSFFRAELGGGVVGDRAVYPLSLAIDLLGPASLLAASHSTAQGQVEDEVSALLRHEGGAVSSIYASARTAADNGLVIHGTEGTLRFVGPIYRPFGIEFSALRARRRGARAWSSLAVFKEERLMQGLRQRLDRPLGWLRRTRRISAPYIGNGYAHEAIALMESMRDGRLEHPLMPLDTSLAIAKLVDQIKETGIR
jgi:predicted dehydrogenase